MLDLRNLWRRHKRKVFVTVGVVGTGYALYKLYDSHRTRINKLEKQLESERQANELIKNQLQSHFENIQLISDTTTLPYAVHYLRSRVSEELDVSQLTEKLMQGKGQSSALTPKEKLELWERLKVLSFTRTAVSLWGMTMLYLYVRVQVNILGRHLYVEASRGLGRPQLQEEADSYTRHGHQDFLATADYLSSYGLSSLISNMQSTVYEVLKDKQLKDPFNMNQLQETILEVLESFMNIGEPNYWLNYVLPENATKYRQLMAISWNGCDDPRMLMDINKLEQLMMETRTVLSSPDFRNVMDISMKKVVEVLVQDVSAHFSSSNSSAAVPLAKLLPRIAQLGSSLLEEPATNKFIQMIRTLPEIELFYTLLYSNAPPPI